VYAEAGIRAKKYNSNGFPSAPHKKKFRHNKKNQSRQAVTKTTLTLALLASDPIKAKKV
jgi:hypothetical protein